MRQSTSLRKGARGRISFGNGTIAELAEVTWLCNLSECRRAYLSLGTGRITAAEMQLVKQPGNSQRGNYAMECARVTTSSCICNKSIVLGPLAYRLTEAACLEK